MIALAHFAELDENSTVLRVLVIGNDDLGNLPFFESEPVGVSFCQSLYGAGTAWKQTSYNANFCKNYAGIGFTYDPVRDAFIPPRPEGDGWILDETTCNWVNPTIEQFQTAAAIGVTRV